MRTLDLAIAKLSLWAASRVLILGPFSVLFSHAFIIVGVLPRDIVWGGQLTDQTFIPFELLALTINLLLMLVGGVAGGFINRQPRL